ncbi:MAG: M48 family metalloprotease [Promethearchaeota archaeon]
MKKHTRFSLFIIYILISIVFVYTISFFILPSNLNELIYDWTLWLTLFFYFLSINEFYYWVKNGKRSEMSDLVAIVFFFFFILFFTKDFMTSLMGAFSIYLWFGIYELKDYPVINKILIISLVTYNIIFIAGLISFYVGDPFVLNTTFAFSFWIILGLGFILFGRRYIVVWRFMSPAYLTLFLYIIAWLAVIFINQYTPIEFSQNTPLNLKELNFRDLFLNIYFVLIFVNWVIYFVSGPILDKMLGIKRVKDNDDLLELVKNVQKDIGVKGKVKVGFGKYPILNAMAYGSVFDKRIAIIAEEIDRIPEDELKGIVAHELAHTKGKHTLILTFIATGDLFIRMLFGLPATYYDYTFGNPRIPMISFIFLNLGIFIFIYIFIRILEGKADEMTKKAGYKNELAKALYNLESFYATGREFGLNTMLLCDEKITKNNQILDYFDTATYLYNYMIKPSRGSLLANFFNSHPPSYHRIGAILGDELKPGKEALLPFICLKRSKQKIYAKKFEKARNAFKIVANEKFKEFFDIDDISVMLEKIGRRNLYELDFKSEFIFKNKITDEIIIGRLEDVQFLDDICDPDQLIITELNTNKTLFLKASLFSRIKIGLSEQYYLQNDVPLTLKNIELNRDRKEGFYIFMDKFNNEIRMPLKKVRMPNSMQIIYDLKNKDVFFKIKGELKRLKCVKINKSENIKDFEIELIDPTAKEKENTFKYKLKDLIIRPKKIYLSISRNLYFRKAEVEILKWLLDKQIRSYIYLKKPVNNLEIGYFLNLNVDVNNIQKIQNSIDNNQENSIVVKNIFGEEKNIPYKILEIISFEYNTITFQKRADTSFFTKFGYKLVKKFKPQKIIYA